MQDLTTLEKWIPQQDRAQNRVYADLLSRARAILADMGKSSDFQKCSSEQALRNKIFSSATAGSFTHEYRGSPDRRSFAAGRC